jgi:hypothetical protein
MESAGQALSAFLKNNTKRQETWQEIVGFS